MHLYWRIQQDLSCLGETIGFTHPGLRRCYLAWLRKHAHVVALAEGVSIAVWGRPPNLN